MEVCLDGDLSEAVLDGGPGKNRGSALLWKGDVGTWSSLGVSGRMWLKVSALDSREWIRRASDTSSAWKASLALLFAPGSLHVGSSNSVRQAVEECELNGEEAWDAVGPSASERTKAVATANVSSSQAIAIAWSCSSDKHA